MYCLEMIRWAVSLSPWPEENCTSTEPQENEWQGNKDSNLGMLESKSSALTSLAIPLRN
jgi:hypothetical protein